MSMLSAAGAEDNGAPSGVDTLKMHGPCCKGSKMTVGEHALVGNTIQGFLAHAKAFDKDTRTLLQQ